MTMSRRGNVGSTDGTCIIGSIASPSASDNGNSSISTINFEFREKKFGNQRSTTNADLHTKSLLLFLWLFGFGASRFNEVFQLGHEGGDVFEFKIYRCKSNIRNFIERLEASHYSFADIAGRKLAV